MNLILWVSLTGGWTNRSLHNDMTLCPGIVMFILHNYSILYRELTLALATCDMCKTQEYSLLINQVYVSDIYIIHVIFD